MNEHEPLTADCPCPEAFKRVAYCDDCPSREPFYGAAARAAAMQAGHPEWWTLTRWPETSE